MLVGPKWGIPHQKWTWHLLLLQVSYQAWQNPGFWGQDTRLEQKERQDCNLFSKASFQQEKGSWPRNQCHARANESPWTCLLLLFCMKKKYAQKIRHLGRIIVPLPRAQDYVHFRPCTTLTAGLVSGLQRKMQNPYSFSVAALTKSKANLLKKKKLNCAKTCIPSHTPLNQDYRDSPQACTWLCENYRVILLSKFGTSMIVNNLSGRIKARQSQMICHWAL